jgi:hypothetical protein
MTSSARDNRAALVYLSASRGERLVALMADTVIRVGNLSKQYVLSHQQQGVSKYKTLFTLDFA